MTFLLGARQQQGLLQGRWRWHLRWHLRGGAGSLLRGALGAAAPPRRTTSPALHNHVSLLHVSSAHVGGAICERGFQHQVGVPLRAPRGHRQGAAFGGGLRLGLVDVNRHSEGTPDVLRADSEVAQLTSRGLGSGPARGRRIHRWSAARLLHCGLLIAWGRPRRTRKVIIRAVMRLDDGTLLLRRICAGKRWRWIIRCWVCRRSCIRLACRRNEALLAKRRRGLFACLGGVLLWRGWGIELRLRRWPERHRGAVYCLPG